MKKAIVLTLLAALCALCLSGCAGEYDDAEAWLDGSLESDDVKKTLYRGVSEYYCQSDERGRTLLAALETRLGTARDESERVALIDAMCYLDACAARRRDGRVAVADIDYASSTDVAMDALMNADWSGDSWFTPLGSYRRFGQSEIFYSAINGDPARARSVATRFLASSGELSEDELMSALRGFDAYCHVGKAFSDEDTLRYDGVKNMAVAWELLPDIIAGGWLELSTDGTYTETIAEAVKWRVGGDRLITAESKTGDDGSAQTTYTVDFPGVFAALQSDVLPQKARFAGYEDEFELGVAEMVYDLEEMDASISEEDIFAVARFTASQPLANEAAVKRLTAAYVNSWQKPLEPGRVAPLQTNEPSGRKIGGTAAVLQHWIRDGEEKYLLCGDAMGKLPSDKIAASLETADLLIVCDNAYYEHGTYDNGVAAYSTRLTACAYDAKTGEKLAVLGSADFDPPGSIRLDVEGKSYYTVGRLEPLMPDILSYLADE